MGARARTFAVALSRNKRNFVQMWRLVNLDGMGL